MAAEIFMTNNASDVDWNYNKMHKLCCYTKQENRPLRTPGDGASNELTESNERTKR